ncbi:MAG TPA: hypothetical protein VLI90_09575, partial [Tepidisphaeraceae bacterium]|nr:hypothetical protein [Tepidisphaeraceae bacterium]
RYRGEPASPYVATQEFMMQEAERHGLDYTHLALYLCGDNLYPTIRDVPPVRGEESICPDGRPMGTYKYWSPRAQAAMVEHVRGLLNLYGKGMRRRTVGSSEAIVMQTMFEPIPKPSFDDEGRQRYLAWLQRRYGGDIAKLNQRYQLNPKSFEQLRPDQYWLRPEELNWVGCARPSAADFANRTPDFHRWIDNQTYLADELDEYLRTMKQHWRELETPLFIEPVLHQWGYFFNPPGHTGWQTGQRALDVYRCAEHVDGVLYIASPLNAENRADAMALSVEASIMRSANRARPFTGGLYLGRHVSGDIYSVVPPAEAIATLIANGATGLHIYGYSGLDDGGVMFRMDQPFKDSLRAGLHWASEVMPLIADQPRTKQVALLFPAEMSLFEPLEVDTEGRHRMDLLGWYAQFVDLGWQVDILHPTQVAGGALAGYTHLVVPHNSLYDLGDNAGLEAAVAQFVIAGGKVFHGPHCELACRALGIEEEPIDFDCIKWREEIIPHGWSTVAYRGGVAIGAYIQSGKTAIAQTSLGAGRVFSFGFEYGYAYSRRTMPIVPPNYGRREIHPIVLLEQTPVAALAGAAPQLPMKPIKAVEFARFGNRLIIVNHRASPIDISVISARRTIPQVPGAPGWLAAHSAVVLETDG